MFFRIALIACVLATALGSSVSPRIVGGQDAEEGVFPYIVSVQLGYRLFHKHICGGSIISENWILTAAQCVHGFLRLPFSNFFVKAGIFQLDDMRQTIKVSRILVHPDYDTQQYSNDIALLKLEKPLKFGPNVGKINLPQADSIPSGNSTLAGWGLTVDKFFGQPENILQSVDLPIISLEDCGRALNDLGYSTKSLEDTMVCTGPLDGGVSACFGDTGGPLVTQNDGNPEQVGIASWIPQQPCGHEGSPSVYTRVSAFIDFINGNTK